MSVRVIFLGPPGAGKGTQAQELAREWGVPHIATGDMLRAEIQAGTEFGLLAQPILAAGQYVSDDIMIGMIRHRLGVNRIGPFITVPREKSAAFQLSRKKPEPNAANGNRRGRRRVSLLDSSRDDRQHQSRHLDVFSAAAVLLAGCIRRIVAL